MLESWAKKWSVSEAALDDLRRRVALEQEQQTKDEISESGVQSHIRLQAAKRGTCLWRNNVGALYDANGRLVRYGLCNDSAAVNKNLKSSDLIGIRPILITPVHIGQTIGQFVSIECKHSKWKYTGTTREQAQLNWLNRVLALGGEARFANGRYV